MRPIGSRWLLFLFPLLIGAASHTHAATTYSVTDLGTLGGSSYGTKISESGNGTGYSLVGNVDHAFFWSPGGGMQDIGNLGGGASHGNDISDDNIVGDTTGQAFRWTPGTGMVLIDSANTGSANGLNANKDAVGSRELGGANARIRTWSPSDTPANPYPIANVRGISINDNGDYIGSLAATAGGFISPASGSPMFIGGSFVPTDLDDNRLITGSVGSIAALLDFDTNTTTMLGKLSPSDTFSRALGISPDGKTFVGVSEGTGAFVGDSTLTIQSLTSLLDSGFLGWTILSASGANNAGQIIGVGLFNGETRAVILNPVPEPSAVALATVGTMVLLAFAARRHSPRRTR